jgi:hypothetical protein
MADALHRLKQLRQVLTDLLDAFQVPSRTGSAVQVEAALQRVEESRRTFDLEAIASAAPQESERASNAIADISRLRAMVCDCAEREREGLGHLLTRARGSSELLRQKQAPEVGPSIDLAGRRTHARDQRFRQTLPNAVRRRAATDGLRPSRRPRVQLLLGHIE